MRSCTPPSCGTRTGPASPRTQGRGSSSWCGSGTSGAAVVQHLDVRVALAPTKEGAVAPGQPLGPDDGDIDLPGGLRLLGAEFLQRAVEQGEERGLHDGRADAREVLDRQEEEVARRGRGEVLQDDLARRIRDAGGQEPLLKPLVVRAGDRRDGLIVPRLVAGALDLLAEPRLLLVGEKQEILGLFRLFRERPQERLSVFAQAVVGAPRGVEGFRSELLQRRVELLLLGRGAQRAHILQSALVGGLDEVDGSGALAFKEKEDSVLGEIQFVAPCFHGWCWLLRRDWGHAMRDAACSEQRCLGFVKRI